MGEKDQTEPGLWVSKYFCQKKKNVYQWNIAPLSGCMTFGVIQRPWENLNVKSDDNSSKVMKTAGLVPERSNFMVVTTSRDDHHRQPTRSRPRLHEVVKPLYRRQETSPHYQLLSLTPPHYSSDKALFASPEC